MAKKILVLSASEQYLVQNMSLSPSSARWRSFVAGPYFPLLPLISTFTIHTILYSHSSHLSVSQQAVWFQTNAINWCQSKLAELFKMKSHFSNSHMTWNTHISWKLWWGRAIKRQKQFTIKPRRYLPIIDINDIRDFMLQKYSNFNCPVRRSLSTVMVLLTNHTVSHPSRSINFMCPLSLEDISTFIYSQWKLYPVAYETHICI